MASTNKYDRQLRLWGANGQESLGTSHVVLLGASGAVGTETLKNLVLPGIGGFTVIDDKPMKQSTDPDPGLIQESNFFIPPPTPATDGEFLAAIVASTLGEMNPEVVANFHCPATPLESFITTGLESFIRTSTTLTYPPPSTPFASGAMSTVLLISNDQPPSTNAAVSALAISLSLPLLIVRTYGFIGSCRLQSANGKFFTTLEPRPDSVKWDLRLTATALSHSAFPALRAFADSRIAAMPAMDSQQHSHVPYPVLLIKTLLAYKATHATDLPTTFAEKEEFKKIIKDDSRDYNMEMNFAEAVEAAYTAYLPPTSIPEEVTELFEMAEVTALTRSSTPFFLLIAALKAYFDANAVPPLNGAIPDMTALTDDYVELQTIYQKQALLDLASFTTLVHATLGSVGLPETTIPPAMIAMFVKNVPYLRVVPSSTYCDEFASPPSPESIEAVQEASWDPYEQFEHSPFIWWLGMRAAEQYHTAHGEWPGKFYEQGGRSKEEEIEKLAALLLDAVAAFGLEISAQLSEALLGKVAEEFCRLHNAENHNVASVIGGVASQEAVKMLTGQYVPIVNTYLFNGIASTAGVFRG